MACSPSLIKTLIAYAGISQGNEDALRAAWEQAIEAILAGEGNIQSASADGSSFTRFTGGMTNEELASCLGRVIDIIDNHGGKMPSSRSFGVIR